MKIHLIPNAGLGNRMRVISSVYRYAKFNSCKLIIHWNKELGLNSEFLSLFEPINNDSLELKDSKVLDFFIYNYPSKFNLFLPKLIDKCFYRRSFYQIGINQLENICKKEGDSVIISSYSQQGKLFPLSELFKPNKSVKSIIDKEKRKFGKYTVGCHIRRTDNTNSTRFSTLNDFYARFDELFEQKPETKILLCTDDIDIKSEIVAKYGNERILTYESTLNRTSKTGIRDAVVELFLLASTNLILGSYYSSYSEMASYLYGTPLEIVKSTK